MSPAFSAHMNLAIRFPYAALQRQVLFLLPNDGCAITMSFLIEIWATQLEAKMRVDFYTCENWMPNAERTMCFTSPLIQMNDMTRAHFSKAKLDFPIAIHIASCNKWERVFCCCPLSHYVHNLCRSLQPEGSVSCVKIPFHCCIDWMFCRSDKQV